MVVRAFPTNEGLAQRLADAHEESGLSELRFQDLRHQAISELAEHGLGDQTIMSIAGHVSRKMLDHYSHIRVKAKRAALEALETPAAVEATPPPTEQTETAPATVH